LLSDEVQNRSSLESLEATSHPFIVRIWLEESAEGRQRAVWRGHITHVPSGERRYLYSLDDMASFVALYLERMGVRLSLGWRFTRWVKRRGQS